MLSSPAFLLIATGFLLGLTFPFGKMAAVAGVSPVIWAFLVSAAPALVLTGINVVTRRSTGLQFRYFRYYVVAAVVSLVIPNLLSFTVIPKLGSGFTGLLFTLSPIFTLLLSSIWHVRVPGRLGVIAIAVGFVGAILVAVTRGDLSTPTSFLWTLAGIGIPASLAVGNVYRTVAWPEGAKPFDLAAGVNLAAAIILLMIILFRRDLILPGGIESIFLVTFATVIASSLMAILHFRLQFFGGPTFLSQIGYVAAAVALTIGTLIFKEQYAWLTWVGAFLILIGTLTGIAGQKKSSG